jgi:CubicO group peptidase (beta-lactamase class C family)
MMSEFPAPENDGGWRKNTTPDFQRAQGFDPEALEEFGRFNLAVPNNQWRPWSEHKGCLVIKNGWIVGEWYEGEDSQVFPQYLASNGKSVAMACFGILVGDSQAGRTPYDLGLESPVYDPRWLPEGFPLSDPRKGRITFDQVFRHISGLCPEADETGRYQEDKNYTLWVVGRDPQYPETAPLYYDPGHPEQYARPNRHDLYTYSSIGFQHVGLALLHWSRMQAHNILEERLFRPIGICSVEYFQPVNEWSAGDENQQVRWHTDGGLRLAPRDYARFAYLLLKDGCWNEQQIVPGGWFSHFWSTGDYPNLLGNQDGAFGREYPADLFRISGAGSNSAFIVPSLDLIALRTGRSSDGLADEVTLGFLKYLFGAILR